MGAALRILRGLECGKNLPKHVLSYGVASDSEGCSHFVEMRVQGRKPEHACATKRYTPIATASNSHVQSVSRYGHLRGANSWNKGSSNCTVVKDPSAQDSRAVKTQSQHRELMPSYGLGI